MLSRVCTLLNSAFLWKGSLGFAHSSGVLGPTWWLGLHLLHVPPEKCDRSRSTQSTMTSLILFCVATTVQADAACSGLVGTLGCTLPMQTCVNLSHATESIGDAWLPQSSPRVRRSNYESWAEFIGAYRDSAGWVFKLPLGRATQSHSFRGWHTTHNRDNDAYSSSVCRYRQVWTRSPTP